MAQQLDTLDPEQRADRVAQRMTQIILPPKDMRIVREGDVLHIVLVDRGRFADSSGVSGADHYAIYWAEDVDESTQAGVDAGAARATKVGDESRAWIENKEITHDVSNARYQNGFFYVYGANVLGERSERYLFSGRQSNAVADSSLPDEVTYFDATENGLQQQGTVVSRIDWRYFAPYSKSFDGVQWVLKDYPNLGDVTRYVTQKFLGAPGGLATGFFTALPARRKGKGTSITIAGTNVTVAGGELLTQAQAGDVLEILGVQATIASVTNNGAMVLTAAWTGESISAYTGNWTIIGKVTIYANAVSKAGTHGDYTNAPSKALLFDAEMSAPLKPVLTAVAAGNLIRLYATVQGGDELESVILYRGTGSGVAFASCSAIKTWPSDKIKAAGPTLTHEDTDFTTYQRENAQVFTYYVVAVNRRGQASLPSDAATATCRLDGGKEGSDPTGKLGAKNLLYNGFVGGTAGNQVRANDTSQDYWFDTDASNLPGVPFNALSPQAYGTGRFVGHTRWESSDGGTGAVGIVTFQNGTEVRIPPPGGAATHFLWQEIEAWESTAGVVPGRYRYRRIKRSGIYTLSAKIKREAGSQPNGWLSFYLEQYNNGAYLGNSERRYRDSTDALLWTTANYSIGGSELLTDWQLYYATFRMRADLTPVQQLRANIAWHNGTQGGIVITEIMLNEGEEFGVFTGDMPLVSWPAAIGDPPADLGDGDGRRVAKILVP